MTCTCCGQRYDTSGYCPQCTVRTFCSCGAQISCGCGRGIADHACPSITILSTTIPILSTTIPIGTIMASSHAEPS